MVRLRASALVIAALFVSCKNRSTDSAAHDAAVAPPQPSVAMSAFLDRILDAGRPDAGPHDAGPPVEFDAGASSCRLLYGPAELPLSGPLTLVAGESSLEVVAHKNGLVKTTTFPIEPIASAKPTGKKPLGATAEKASRPACAVAGPYAFCADANGDVHRALRARAGDAVVAHSDAGTRVTAAWLGGRAVLGYLAVRTTSEGRTSEAFAKLEDQEPVRISESGSGATEVVFSSRGSEVVAMMIDARRAMSPVHARVLTVKDNKIALGPDNVVYVGGGSDHQVHGSLALDSKGNTFALMPTSVEDGFGLAIIRIDSPPKLDEPSSVSLYPNGLDFSAAVGTRGVDPIVVVRVRPATREVSSPRVLEIGKLDPHTGAFSSLGFIPTSGPIPNATVEADRYGATWIAYTDGSGTWLERRACP